MKAEDISGKIYKLMLPFTTEDLPPVAYVSIEVGNDFQISDEEIRSSFDKVKWDTALSSAELLILRKPKSSFSDSSVILGGFSFFNDDVDGCIDEAGDIPTFCFIGKSLF
ncbi:MAG: hypothetical protein J5505_02265 [Spirochaetaceae bacterium]|nr:hypothetical protein [Spirochaetaceae bacterium]